MKKKSKITILIIAFIILLPLSVILLLWGLFFVSDYLCGNKNNLGNNIYMVEDGNFREIVYCTKHKGNTCYVGIPLIPAISSKGISVIEAKSNDEWVIVKALNNALSEKNCFYLIDKSFDLQNADCRERNCDSIIQSYITYFDNEQDFENRLYDLGLSLRFGDK